MSQVIALFLRSNLKISGANNAGFGEIDLERQYVKGVVFLGPPAVSMAALGDKIGSPLIAQAAEVPTLSWNGSHVKIPPGVYEIFT
ncbi:acetyl-CoA carboxylase 1-like [Arachis duranensis]|uniref:Acetyl-CoA carboxylase 1-like n=1 Tax=Arachis duranensis TaxID=130453 RepID=A0A9C6U062_ARADU|nr:acetyl-CoA carboxylase 1-like [Arachis duranensis]